MSPINKVVLSAAMTVSVLAFPVKQASAAIACVGPVCWHVHEEYRYPPDARVMVHPDDWRWGPEEHYSWREHEGRGYWEGDRWREW
jgi:hypothetical protein